MTINAATDSTHVNPVDFPAYDPASFDIDADDVDYVFVDFGNDYVRRFRDDAIMYATVDGVADGTYPAATTDMGTTFDVVIYDGAVTGINA